jgi:hypothetical protein
MAGISWAQFASAIGAGCLFLGGALLAFAASRELHAYRLAILALQAQTVALVASVVSGGSEELVIVDGIDKHIATGRRWNTCLTWAGLTLIFAAFVLTVLAFFLACP